MLVAVLIWGLVIPAFAVTASLLLSRAHARRVRRAIDPEAGAEVRRIHAPADAHGLHAQRTRARLQRSRRGRCGTVMAGPARNRPSVRRAQN